MTGQPRNIKHNLIVTTSWDDGTVADLKLAELLSKYNIRGTFYVARDYGRPLPQRDMLALDGEFEIGAHTLSHPDLTRLSLAEAKREIEGSRAYLEDQLGHGVTMFCYPYGKYNQQIKELVRSAGFTAARTCHPGGFNLSPDPYQWHITTLASNGSPLMAVKTLWRFHLGQAKALFDWEVRARLLFDLALGQGGVYHIYGHAEELAQNDEWDKIERVLDYLASREGVSYLTNGEVWGQQKKTGGAKCRVPGNKIQNTMRNG